MRNLSTYGLVCAGGGAHGAYQVGVLKYIHEYFSRGNQSPFQIFVGASCGALNTSFYAAQSFDAYSNRLRLEELWMDFHVPMYHGNIFKNALLSLYREWRKPLAEKESTWAILDPRPMHQVVEKGFSRANLDRSFSERTTLGIAVATTELLSGRTCWFQEGPNAADWNLFHSVGLVDAITPAHVAASCTVPIFLPPVQIGGRYHLDGSISLDRPLSAAIYMGASRVLSISTDKPSLKDLPPYPQGFKPRLSNVIRMLLNRLSHDAAADEAAQIEMLNRFYAALSRKSRRHATKLPWMPLFHEEAHPAHYKHTEVFLFYPSKRIRQSAEIWDESELMAIEMAKAGKKRPRTRFMFHQNFIRQLIHLGYEDAKLRHDELKQFFLPRTPKRRWLFFKKSRPLSF